MDYSFDFKAIRPEMYPSFLSIKEATDLAILKEEEEFNHIMQDIALDELGLFESTGTTKVYTEADNKGIIDRVKGFFENAWSFIKGLYEKLLKAIDNTMTNIRTKIADKISKNIFDQAKNMAKYTKDKSKVLAKAHTWENMSTKDSLLGALADACKLNNWESENFDPVSKFANSVGLGNISDISGLKKSLEEHIKGPEMEITYDTIDKVKELIDVIIEYKGFTNEIKKNYNEAKKIIDSSNKEFISGIKDESKQTAMMKAAKGSMKLVTAVSGVVCSCYKSRFNEAVSVTLRLAFLANKTKKKEAANTPNKEEVKKEAAITLEKEIDSLFAW